MAGPRLPASEVIEPGTIETTTARVAVVPSRVGYLIAAGSSDGFRRAVREASTRWAGQTEPIIPVLRRRGLAPAWRQMLEFAKVDCLVNVDAPAEVAARAGSSMSLPVISIKNIDRSGPSRWTTHPANVADLSQRSNGSTMACASDAALWQIAAGGDLSEESFAEVKSTGFTRRPRTEDEVGRAQLGNSTLLDRGVEQFGEHQATNGPGPSPAFLWITRPNSVKDCVWFWNCRSLRPLTFDRLPMHLLPHRGLDAWVGFGDQLQATLERAADIEPDLIVCSLSVDDAELASIVEQLGLRPSIKKLRTAQRFPPPPVRSAPFTYKLGIDPREFVLFAREYGRTTDAVVHVGGPRTILRVESPVRFTGSGYALVRLSSAAFEHIPRVPATATTFMRNATWVGSALQIATNATSPYQLEFRVPTLQEATWTVLNANTSSASLSDKGRLAHRLKETIDDGTIELDESAFDFLAALMTPRSKELQKELERVKATGAEDTELLELATMWGGRSQRRHRSVNELKGVVGKRAYDLSEGLAAAGWVERGLEIRCTECSIRSFVALGKVQSAADCPACSSRQEFTKGPGLAVQYRLNGLVDRALDQGVVPHLMANAALQARDARTDLLLGVDVEFGPTAAEVDLFGVHGGLVVSGEVKTSPAEFTPTQLERDVDISKRLGADWHLIASPRALQADLLERVWRRVKPRGMALAVIQGHRVQEVRGT